MYNHNLNPGKGTHKLGPNSDPGKYIRGSAPSNTNFLYYTSVACMLLCTLISHNIKIQNIMTSIAWFPFVPPAQLRTLRARLHKTSGCLIPGHWLNIGCGLNLFVWCILWILSRIGIWGVWRPSMWQVVVHSYRVSIPFYHGQN